MKKKHIVVVPPFSWKARAALFASTFGILWLFLEPISAFFGTSALSSLGFWGYLGMIFASALLTFGIEVCNRATLHGSMSFVTLKIILTSAGTEHAVEVPLDMQVGKAVDLFLSKVSNRVLPTQILSVLHLYEKTLWVKRSDDYEQVPRQKTIRDAGLTDSDVCQIHGNLLKDFFTISLCRPYWP